MVCSLGLFSSLFHYFTFSVIVFSARSKSLVMGEQIGPPSRPSSPNPQERVLKCGWLKKQRSIMKNWQQRWFVLRGDQLFYYKDEEETKPQVRLFLELYSVLGCDFMWVTVGTFV